MLDNGNAAEVFAGSYLFVAQCNTINNIKEMFTRFSRKQRRELSNSLSVHFNNFHIP